MAIHLQVLEEERARASLERALRGKSPEERANLEILQAIQGARKNLGLGKTSWAKRFLRVAEKAVTKATEKGFDVSEHQNEIKRLASLC